MNDSRSRIRDRRGIDGGFTLVELLVVITILGILAAIVVFSVQGLGDKGEAAALSADQRIMTTAEEAYCAKNSEYGTADQLVSGGFLSAKSVKYDVFTNTVAAGSPNGPCGTKAYSLVPKPERTKYPLTITQADGTKTVLNAAPQRIVTINNNALSVEFSCALGVCPIGGESGSNTTVGFESYSARGLPLWLDNTTAPSVPCATCSLIGQWTTTTDDAGIGALHPDIIIGYGGANVATPARLATLKAFAPVVSVPTGGIAAPPTNADSGGVGITNLAWYPLLREMAVILDKQAEFTQFLKDFQADAQAAAPQLAGKTAHVLLLFNNGTQFSTYAPGYYSARNLTYLGVKVPELTNVPGFPFTGGSDATNSSQTLSYENAGILNKADWLVFQAFAPGVAAGFLASPAVAALPSVQAGHYVDASSGTPFQGYPSKGPIGSKLCIPLLAAAMNH